MSEGFCHTKSLLQELKLSEGDETLKIFKTLTELLRKGPETKDFFYELNGVSVVLNISMGADVPLLNCVLDALAAAAEDHDGNRAKLTIDRTFIIINKVLISREALGLTASLRALVLLSYVCGENPDAQDLANRSGCVNRMGEFFTRLSEDILKSDEVKKDKIIFTWNILCTAIAAVCGEPPNKKNQECLQSVIRKSVDFLSEWIDASKDVIQEVSCVKTLLIMLPYVLCDNKTNQDCFARSGGVHTVINGLLELENKKTSDDELDEIRVKLVYLLYISLMENPLTSKLAGFLGAIPVLFRLLKQFHQKDKGTVLMCLSTLLNCPENEDIFNRLDIFTDLTSQVKMFAEGSECRKIIEQICSLSKAKQSPINSDPDKSRNLGNKGSGFDMLDTKPSSLRHLQRNGRKPDEMGFREFQMTSDRNRENKFKNRSLYPKQVHSTKDDYFFDKERSHFNSFERSQNDSKSLHDESLLNYDLDRKSRFQNDDKRKTYRESKDSYYMSSEDMHNWHCNDKGLYSRSSNESGYEKNGYYENNFNSKQNLLNGHSLKLKASTSELMNKARRLYPRNKMAELEEINIHQKRHYLSKCSDIEDDDSMHSVKIHPRSFGERKSGELGFNSYDNQVREHSRYSMDSQMSDDLKLEDDIRRDYRRTSVDRYSRDDFRRGDPKREFSRSSVERHSKDFYMDEEARREHPKTLERGFRGNYNMNEEMRREHLKALREQTLRNDEDDDDDDPRTTSSRSSLGTPRREDSRKEHIKTSIEKQNRSTCNVDYEHNMEGSRDIKNEGHRRSKSMGRVVNLDVHTMIKNMDCSSKDRQSSQQPPHKSFLSSISKSKCQYYNKENTEIPQLLDIRDTNFDKEICNTSLEESSQIPKENDPKERKISVNYEVITPEFDKSKFKDDLHSTFNSVQSYDSNEASCVNTCAAETSLEHSVLAFSEEEEKHLLAGLKKFGLDFKSIHQEFTFHEKRTPHDLYEKWKCCYNNI